MKELWIVGQITVGLWDFREKSWSDKSEWEFAGVFDSEEKAINACRTSEYFIAPIELNKELPHETVDMVGGYYPLEIIKES